MATHPGPAHLRAPVLRAPGEGAGLEAGRRLRVVGPGEGFWSLMVPFWNQWGSKDPWRSRWVPCSVPLPCLPGASTWVFPNSHRPAVLVSGVAFGGR